MFKYKKPENDQANKANDKLSSITKDDNSSINVTPTKPIRISSDTFPPTPNSLKFASGDTTPNSLSNGVLSDTTDIINNRRKRENASSSTRRLNIQQNSAPLDTTEMPPANPIQADQETSAMQIKIKEIDGRITPAAYPTSSRQEDEKNERLREFRVQYSLQQPNNSNTNKRKRTESHDNVVSAPYI